MNILKIIKFFRIKFNKFNKFIGIHYKFSNQQFNKLKSKFNRPILHFKRFEEIHPVLNRIKIS